MYNQGIVLYETKLNPNQDYALKVVVHDFGVVYLGHKAIQVLDRTKSKDHVININQEILKEHGSRLWILV